MVKAAADYKEAFENVGGSFAVPTGNARSRGRHAVRSLNRRHQAVEARAAGVQRAQPCVEIENVGMVFAKAAALGGYHESQSTCWWWVGAWTCWALRSRRTLFSSFRTFGWNARHGTSRRAERQNDSGVSVGDDEGESWLVRREGVARRIYIAAGGWAADGRSS